MKIVCPYFLALSAVGSRPVFMSGLEKVQWSPVVERVDTEITLAEKAQGVSMRLAEEVLTGVLSEDPKLIQGIPQDLLGAAKAAIGEKIYAFLKKGAPVLRNLERSHNEEVIKLTTIYAYEIAAAVCDSFAQRARIIEMEAKANADRQVLVRQKATIQDLKAKVNTDPLTELSNRRVLEKRIPMEIKRVDKTGKPLCVLIFDLDWFKQVNDRHGHKAGDNVLKEMARRLRQILRGTDVLVRTGGDEFIILRRDTDKLGAIALGHEIVMALEQNPIYVKSESGESVKVDLGASIGIGIYEGKAKGQKGEDTIQKADRSQYVLKGLRPDKNGKTEQRRGQIAVDDEVFTHEEIQALFDARDGGQGQK